MATFTKEKRLLRKEQFDAVLNNGTKIVCRDFVLVASNEKKDLSRLGLIVSKKVGNSVSRNRIKRCVRSYFRNLDTSQLDRDLVVIARPSLTAERTKKVNLNVNLSFETCLNRLIKSINKKDQKIVN
jgi:ribonuclease P protein component